MKKDENLKTFETKAVTHMDELRELNMKKDENLKTFEKKALMHMDELRELNMKKDEDIEHLRNIIKQIHESPAWKLIKKIDFLKKNN